MLESAASGSGLRARGEPGRSSYGGSILSVTEDEGFESVSMSPDARSKEGFFRVSLVFAEMCIIMFALRLFIYSPKL